MSRYRRPTRPPDDITYILVAITVFLLLVIPCYLPLMRNR